MGHETWNVVFVVNESFAQGLAAAVRSLVKYSPSSSLTFWVINIGLSDTFETKLRQLVQAPNTIRFITEEFSKSFPDDQNLGPARAPAEAWVKLRLGQVLPRNLDVILYMDADMVAQTSIEPLMKTDLKGHPLGAVSDFGMPCGHSKLEEYGWEMQEPYFNAGMMLLSLQALRGLEKDLQEVAAASDDLLYGDQDALNLVFRGNRGWLQLDLKWNVQGLGSYASCRTAHEPGRPALFTKEELKGLESNPGIVHFTGPVIVHPSKVLNPYMAYTSKPWSYLCNHPFKETFFTLLDETPWAGWRPSQDSLVPGTVQDIRGFMKKVADQHPDFDQEKFLRAVFDKLIPSNFDS